MERGFVMPQEKLRVQKGSGVQEQSGPDRGKPELSKQAVALTYEPGREAPVIVAAGRGLIAERIIETAKENDVPLYADGKLADTLLRLEIGDTIPPELYKVVAEILVFVDHMDKLKGKINK